MAVTVMVMMATNRPTQLELQTMDNYDIYVVITYNAFVHTIDGILLEQPYLFEPIDLFGL